MRTILIAVAAVACGISVGPAMPTRAATWFQVSQGGTSGANCSPSPGSSGSVHPRRIRDRNWQQTVTLGPCVSEGEALAILRAIRDGSLINRQPVQAKENQEGKAGQQQAMPKVHVSEVSGILRAYPELIDAYRAPSHQFTVSTINSRFEGVILFIDLRDGQVELVGHSYVEY